MEIKSQAEVMADQITTEVIQITFQFIQYLIKKYGDF